MPAQPPDPSATQHAAPGLWATSESLYAWMLFLASFMLAACRSGAKTDRGAIENGRPIPMAHAETFTVMERDGYRIADIEASLVSWGGAAGGPPQRARLVLLPKGVAAPKLQGDLAGATLIRIPVMRIAVNDQPHEAMLRALGIADRIVAVGGHESYDDDIRARVRRGEVQQVGYGWHQPPILDALIASKAEVFIARMADLTHTQQLERVETLGIPVLPTFIDAEPHYLGRTEWVRLIGMMTGREREAERFVEEVRGEVDRLTRLAAEQPRRSLLWAWYSGGSDRWSVTQRNSDAALIRAANAEVVLSAPDDPRLDSFSRLSTEQLLNHATKADCWMIRDPLSSRFDKPEILEQIKAYRDGCLFYQTGLKNPDADAWELWEMGAIRPDWLLADIVKMVHPQLRDGTWRYHAVEHGKGADAGKSAH